MAEQAALARGLPLPPVWSSRPPKTGQPSPPSARCSEAGRQMVISSQACRAIWGPCISRRMTLVRASTPIHGVLQWQVITPLTAPIPTRLCGPTEIWSSPSRRATQALMRTPTAWWITIRLAHPQQPKTSSLWAQAKTRAPTIGSAIPALPIRHKMPIKAGRLVTVWVVIISSARGDSVIQIASQPTPSPVM